MHPQYIGDLGDSENTPEFPMLDPTPFQRLTNLRFCDVGLARTSGVVNRRSPEPRVTQNLLTLFQIFAAADVQRDSSRAKLRCNLTSD
jgi:hypothetical protein